MELKTSTFAVETKLVEELAMKAVMEMEESLGRTPSDVSSQKIGYDVESRTADGKLLFIEVKGRRADADTVTITKNEILTALNKPDHFKRWYQVDIIAFIAHRLLLCIGVQLHQ